MTSPQHLRPPAPLPLRTPAHLRENTERQVTVTQGTNTIVGCDPERIVTEALAILDGRNKAGRVRSCGMGRQQSEF